MGEQTIIAWTEHTLNFWMGCNKVSPGCKQCYAETAMERYGRDFGTVTRTKTWNDAYKWNKRLEGTGQHEMVFTCSWSDFFHSGADKWRPDAWKVIRETPNLFYQILTKRPERIHKCLPDDWRDGYPNVWLGVSAENQKYFDLRWPLLAEIPAAVWFISYEPALGPLLLYANVRLHQERLPDWVICGGESGPGYREMPHDWARVVRDQCKAAKIAFFFKQSSAMRTEMGIQLDGQIVREYPKPRLTHGGKSHDFALES